MSTADSTVEYREIKGFPGYRVGNDGTVWTRWKKIGLGYGGGTRYVLGDVWRILKPGEGRGGYHIVTLCPGRRTRFVHQLVLEAFVGPKPQGQGCRHFPDRNRTNNRLENLQWGTAKENADDRITHGTYKRGETHAMAILSGETVEAIRAEYDAKRRGRGKVPNGFRQYLAAKYKVNESTLKKIIGRQTWKHIP